MNCQQAKPLIDAYADGELEAAGILELEQHFRDCPACARAARNLQSLRQSMKQDALYFTAPAELRKAVKAQLRSRTEASPQRAVWNWNWLTAAVSGAAGVCLALLLTFLLTRSSEEQRLGRELVSSHVRSLMANHALDIASSDHHTVKPWFDGKLDFSPPVKDLTAQGFPLVGGRLDYLGERAVASLVFQRRSHTINLFVWPAAGVDSKAAAIAAIQGYHLVHWSQNGMVFWAVSNLNEAELEEFALAFSRT